MSVEADSDLTSYYAARAQEYESIYDKPERQADLATLRALVPDYFVGRDVLEVACGTGYWTQFIARRAASIAATDINAETLAIARTKPLPAGRVTFAKLDIHQLDAGERRYTGAFAGFWWSHLRTHERSAFIGTLHRALKPGAVVVVLDNLYVAGSSTPISHVDADGNSFQERRLRDGSKHTVLKNFPNEDALLADIRGFGVAPEYRTLDYYWVFKYQVA